MVEIGDIPEFYVRIIAYNKVLDILNHESYYNGNVLENGNQGRGVDEQRRR